MGNMWLKIKIWTKGIIFGLLALYILVFFLKNDTPVTIWYWPFKDKYSISVIWLTVAVLFVGVIGTILVRTTLNTLSQFKDMRNQSRIDKLEREHANMKAKAAMLQTRTATVSQSSSDGTTGAKVAEGKSDNPQV